MKFYQSSVDDKKQFLILLIIWLGLTQVSTAQSPPALPETRQWNEENAGVHWFQSETLTDVEGAFNAARRWENIVLMNNPGAAYLPIADMNLSGAFTIEEWYALSYEERAFWLINDERAARNLPPYEGIDSFLSEVTSDYATYMLETGTSGHSADGRSPLERTLVHPEIDGGCPTIMQESISYTGGTDERNAYFPIAIAVYNWVYAGTYGHRTSILYHGEYYQDDTGTVGMEGLFGIGIVEGKGYMGFNGMFDKNVQIAVYVYYDPANGCANIPPVSIEDNTLQLSEIDYATNDDTTFVEFYNSGSTSLSLREYTFVVDGITWQLPPVAVPAEEYLMVCSNKAAMANCDYELSNPINWSEDDTLTFSLSNQIIDTIALVNDDPTAPESSLSFLTETNEWAIRCATPNSQTSIRDGNASLCNLPFGKLSQEATVTYEDDKAMIEYAITIVSDGQIVSDSQFLPTTTSYDSYNCDGNIVTELIAPSVLQGHWSCRAEIPLAYNRCTPELVHEVILNITGLIEPVTNTDTTLIECSTEIPLQITSRHIEIKQANIISLPLLMSAILLLLTNHYIKPN